MYTKIGRRNGIGKNAFHAPANQRFSNGDGME